MTRLPGKLAGDRMYELTQDAAWVHGIDLAQEADFDLGLLRVRPARCEVEWNGVSQTLQRRVMQVLVALAHARGSVVSQDDLVMRCWRGLAVSDDAIYRCISKLRKLAAGYPDVPSRDRGCSGRRLSPHVAEHSRRGRRRGRVLWRHIIAASGFRAFVTAAALAILVLAAATFSIVRGRVSDDRHPVRVVVQPFDTLTNADDVRALARRISNEVVNEFGDSQIVAVLAGEQSAPRKSARTGRDRAPARDDASNLIAAVRVEDGATHAALWSMEFKRDRREASDLPMGGCGARRRRGEHGHFRAERESTADRRYCFVRRTADKRSHPGLWAEMIGPQMIERAQGIVASHPEFAFGHSLSCSRPMAKRRRTSISPSAPRQ